MTRFRRLTGLGLLITALACAHSAWAGTTRITWHGHAAFEIETPRGRVLFIDPWLNNPRNPAVDKDTVAVEGVDRADYILLTHAHPDHVGDAVPLAEKTGARLITSFELGTQLGRLLGYPEDQMGYDTLMNIGGSIRVADGEVTVHMTPAVHSSGLRLPDPGPDMPSIVYGGNPAGFVVEIHNGPTIYHTGDTAYFSDMRLIGEHHRPDVALINSGGHFGMEPARAAEAAKAVRATMVVPHHYGTFPVLAPDAREFARHIEALEGVDVRVLEPGDSLTVETRAPEKEM
ncbi:MAG: metal-dependent hydrolase [Gammaproteobacteria bacterium]|nr:metal-dependent hydrolase [Gammaproteobacteria bacterium]